jgi:hypothetical protein
MIIERLVLGGERALAVEGKTFAVMNREQQAFAK